RDRVLEPGEEELGRILGDGIGVETGHVLGEGRQGAEAVGEFAHATILAPTAPPLNPAPGQGRLAPAAPRDPDGTRRPHLPTGPRRPHRSQTTSSDPITPSRRGFGALYSRIEHQSHVSRGGDPGPTGGRGSGTGGTEEVDPAAGGGSAEEDPVARAERQVREEEDRQ